MPRLARTTIVAASSSSAGSAARTRSGVGAAANNSTSTRWVASSPNVDINPAAMVATATTSVRVRSARHDSTTAAPTHRGSSLNTVRMPAVARACMPVCHDIVRSSGRTDSPAKGSWLWACVVAVNTTPIVDTFARSSVADGYDVNARQPRR
jgi:hypothetical protein